MTVLGKEATLLVMVSPISILMELVEDTVLILESPIMASLI